jgi:hypothetical protein
MWRCGGGVYTGPIFSRLRAQCGLSDAALLQSFTDASLPCIDVVVNTARSASFFWYTFDRRFVVKTLTQSEKDTLCKKMLKPYYQVCAWDGMGSDAM